MAGHNLRRRKVTGGNLRREGWLGMWEKKGKTKIKYPTEIRLRESSKKLWFGTHTSKSRAARAYDFGAYYLDGVYAQLHYEEEPHPQVDLYLPPHLLDPSKLNLDDKDTRRTLIAAARRYAIATAPAEDPPGLMGPLYEKVGVRAALKIQKAKEAGRKLNIAQDGVSSSSESKSNESSEDRRAEAQSEAAEPSKGSARGRGTDPVSHKSNPTASGLPTLASSRRQTRPNVPIGRRSTVEHQSTSSVSIGKRTNKAEQSVKVAKKARTQPIARRTKTTPDPKDQLQCQPYYQLDAKFGNPAGNYPSTEQFTITASFLPGEASHSRGEHDSSLQPSVNPDLPDDFQTNPMTGRAAFVSSNTDNLGISAYGQVAIQPGELQTGYAVTQGGHSFPQIYPSFNHQQVPYQIQRNPSINQDQEEYPFQTTPQEEVPYQTQTNLYINQEQVPYPLQTNPISDPAGDFWPHIHNLQQPSAFAQACHPLNSYMNTNYPQYVYPVTNTSYPPNHYPASGYSQPYPSSSQTSETICGQPHASNVFDFESGNLLTVEQSRQAQAYNAPTGQFHNLHAHDTLGSQSTQPDTNQTQQASNDLRSRTLDALQQCLLDPLEPHPPLALDEDSQRLLETVILDYAADLEKIDQASVAPAEDSQPMLEAFMLDCAAEFEKIDHVAPNQISDWAVPIDNPACDQVATPMSPSNVLMEIQNADSEEEVQGFIRDFPENFLTEGEAREDEERERGREAMLESHGMDQQWLEGIAWDTEDTGLPDSIGEADDGLLDDAMFADMAGWSI